jgi:hypothetical protein
LESCLWRSLCKALYHLTIGSETGLLDSQIWKGELGPNWKQNTDHLWEVLDRDVQLALFCGKWSWDRILEDHIEFINHLSCDQYALFKSIFLVIKCKMYFDQLTRLSFDRTSKTALANLWTTKLAILATKCIYCQNVILS